MRGTLLRGLGFRVFTGTLAKEHGIYIVGRDGHRLGVAMELQVGIARVYTGSIHHTSLCIKDNAFTA